MKVVIWVLIFFAGIHHVASQGFLYQKDHPKIVNDYSPYIKNVKILPDTSNIYAFSFIASLGANLYFLPKDSIQMINPKIYSYWVKFQLTKQQDTTLVITFSPLYSAVIYHKPNTFGRHSKEKGGFNVSNAIQKNHSVPEIIFQIANTDTSTWHYFKIESPNERVGLGFQVFPNSYLIDYLPSNYFKSGLFFGLIFFAIILNLILYFQLRQISYLFYSLYATMFAIYVASEFQFYSLFQLGSYRFTFWIYSIPFVSMTIFLLLYIHSFFPSEAVFKKLKILTLIMIVIRLILFAFAYLFKTNTTLFSLVVDMFCISWPFFMIIYHSKSYKPARYLSIAIGLIFIGYAAHFELFAFNSFLNNTLTIHNLGILEILLLSLALGSRIKNMEAEKQFNSDMLFLELKEKQLLKERINVELEEKVVERTLEINRMNKFLKEHNLHLELEVENLATARVMQDTVSIEEFKKIFPDENVCYNYLAELKWKNGFTCKFCNSNRFVLINKSIAHSRRCSDCKKIESPTANTIFHKLKFPIQKAFYILFLVSAGQKITYEDLSQQVDLRVATCFAFKKKIIEVMELKKSKKKGKMTWSDYILP